MGTAGTFFSRLFDNAETKAKEQQAKFDKEKSEDEGMYRKVLLDPNSSPEQRDKAAAQITKLRGLKKGESPFEKLSGFLNHVGGKAKEKQPMSEAIPGVGGTPTGIGTPGAEHPTSNIGQPPTGASGPQPLSTTSPASLPPLDSKAGHPSTLSRIGHGLAKAGSNVLAGKGVFGTGGAQQQSSLPPIDAGAFGGKSPEQQAEFDRQQKEKDVLADIAMDERILGHPLTEDQKAHKLNLQAKQTWVPVAGTKPFKDPGTGKWMESLRDSSTGQIVAVAMPEGYQPPEQKQNRDDKYIALVAKEKLGEKLTPEEEAYKSAYAVYVQQTKVAPGVARAAAFGAMRYVPVMDPDNPGNVVLMRAGDAAAAKATTPASIAFQIDKAVTNAFTHGRQGDNLTYFNTAVKHLETLKQAADGLKNTDVQMFNQAKNAYANATGDASVVDFNSTRAAVAGELSKAFKGTGATNEEIALINETINTKQSPEQLAGAISYYTNLLNGKMSALQGQYEAGKQGKPNFPNQLPSLDEKTKKSGGAKKIVVKPEDMN